MSLLHESGLQFVNHLVFELLKFLHIFQHGVGILMSLLNSALVHAGIGGEVVIHVVSEYRLCSLALFLYLLVLLFILIHCHSLVNVDHVIYLLSFTFNLGYLTSISLEYGHLAVINVPFLVVASFCELGSAGIFYPFPCDIHCVDHIEFFILLVIDIRNKTLSSSQVLDAFIGQFFFFLELHDPGGKKLMLCEHLLLFVNRFHHVRGCLAADH